MAISLAVAGHTIASRISTGITVQITSAVVLWLNLAATAPLDLRNLNIAQPIAMNTMAPMTTHTHSAIMWAS